MPNAPARPKIYHITHIENLPKIVAARKFWSDAKRIELELECQVVGMSGIKQRRLEELKVKCHPTTMVGEYVPFYFCPRSIMLYILHMGNQPELTYRKGQKPIVHLVADLHATVAWAEARQRLWAFSNCNAGAFYADFFASLADLDKIDWTAVQATDFRDGLVKDGKQAEFLIHKSLPWTLIEQIGVFDSETARQVDRILEDTEHKPVVGVQRAWYF